MHSTQGHVVSASARQVKVPHNPSPSTAPAHPGPAHTTNPTRLPGIDQVFYGCGTLPILSSRVPHPCAGQPFAVTTNGTDEEKVAHAGAFAAPSTWPWHSTGPMFHRYGPITRRHDQMCPFEVHQGWFDGLPAGFPGRRPGGPASRGPTRVPPAPPEAARTGAAAIPTVAAEPSKPDHRMGALRPTTFRG
jgi:hypothetical protein